MNYLIYSSYAVVKFTDDDLKDLLIKARKKNKVIGITGVLYYFDGRFLQLIEGKKKNVRLLYQDICNDTSHRSLLILKEGRIDNRQFKEWTMGFKAISSENVKDVQGFNDLNVVGSNYDSVFSLFKILVL